MWVGSVGTDQIVGDEAGGSGRRSVSVATRFPGLEAEPGATARPAPYDILIECQLQEPR
jgi:hypothetical protein